MSIIDTIYDYIMDHIFLEFLFILFVSLIVAFLAKFILIRILKPLAKKTKTKVDDLIIKSVSSILFYIILAAGFKIGFQTFRFEIQLYNNLVDTLLILLVVIALLKIINNLSTQWINDWAKKTESTADDRLIPLLQKIMKAVVIILAFIFVFDAWEIDISPLLATAGIAGIAIGFAVRDSLANILGGIQRRSI